MEINIPLFIFLTSHDAVNLCKLLENLNEKLDLQISGK